MKKQFKDFQSYLNQLKLFLRNSGNLKQCQYALLFYRNFDLIFKTNHNGKRKFTKFKKLCQKYEINDLAPFIGEVESESIIYSHFEKPKVIEFLNGYINNFRGYDNLQSCNNNSEIEEVHPTKIITLNTLFNSLLYVCYFKFSSQVVEKTLVFFCFFIHIYSY